MKCLKLATKTRVRKPVWSAKRDGGDQVLPSISQRVVIRPVDCQFLRRKRGQRKGALLEIRNLMSLMLSAGRRLTAVGLASLAVFGVSAQSAFSPQQGEYSLTRNLPGDQLAPALGLAADGGYVVWQDNATDGQGFGISARVLNNYLSPDASRSFRVNQKAAGDQENPTVLRLKSGGAIVVWQGGPQGDQEIYARVLAADGTFLGDEVVVNTFLAGSQANPAAAVLSDGSVAVVWSSYGQDGSMNGIYGQRLLADGSKSGPEFQVSQTTAFNQRTPALTALEGGSFVVVWVSEQQRFVDSVDVYGRRFAAVGSPMGGEFLINGSTNLCANPAIAAGPEGRLLAVWSERNKSHPTNGWNVTSRPLASTGSPLAGAVTLSTISPGKRYAPKVAQARDQYLVVWTSDWQDGSYEGVYGRFVKADGVPAADEFRVNTTTVSKQMQPTVAADGDGRFLVAWATFTGLATGYELTAQRYSADHNLAPPMPPGVTAMDSFSLMASWPELSGFSNLTSYLLYVDDALTPLRLTENFKTVGDLDPGSTHSFRLAYELVDGTVSPKSEPASGRTWGQDRNYDGLPDDWQSAHWGNDKSQWPRTDADSDQDGASNLDEFLAGTNPVDGQSVLRTTITVTAQGILLVWNSEPGCVYQIQGSVALDGWVDIGGARYAASRVTSVLLPPDSSASYYRLIRIR